MTAHRIFVCTSCAGKWSNGEPIGESSGKKLLKRLQDSYPSWELNTKFVIQPVECMSVCNHACVVYFTSHGQNTYLFGDISSDLTPAEINDVFNCVGKYYTHPGGSLPRSERPETLKKGILARIPAV